MALQSSGHSRADESRPLGCLQPLSSSSLDRARSRVVEQPVEKVLLLEGPSGGAHRPLRQGVVGKAPLMGPVRVVSECFVVVEGGIRRALAGSRWW